MNALIVARFTLQEAISRRLALAALVLSLAFVGLYALGYSLAYARALDALDDPRSRLVPAVAATMLTTLGLYAVNFLTSFLALFLAVGAISGEIDSGQLHALLARPIRRGEYVLGRWLGFALMTALYVGFMVGALFLIARLIAGYEATDPLRAVLLVLLGALLLMTLGLLGSTCLSTLANGVVCFSLFGLAWLAGIVEFVGASLGNQSMVNLGIVVSLLIPSDGVARAASYYAQSPVALAVLSAERDVVPFASSLPPTTAFVLWSVAYPIACLLTAIKLFGRRDL